MGSGSDESIYWFLSYYNNKIAITHNQLTISIYKTLLSEVSHTMKTELTENHTRTTFTRTARTAEKTPLQVYY
jgi:hypothetical protein